jgi:hypothetical protein
LQIVCNLAKEQTAASFIFKVQGREISGGAQQAGAATFLAPFRVRFSVRVGSAGILF